MSSAPKPTMTSQEYLRLDRASQQERHIFWHGEMYAMSGARRTHVLLAGNVFYHIRHAFEGRDCQVMQSDMRVKNERTGSYFYPDVVATCEEPKYEDKELDTLLNPQVVVEVLSKSTEAFDRGEKFEDYQRLLSLKEYVLVSQHKIHVERFSRTSESTWEYWTSTDPNASLQLSSIDVQITIKDIYAKVVLNEDESNGESNGDDNTLTVVEEKSPYA